MSVFAAGIGVVRWLSPPSAEPPVRQAAVRGPVVVDPREEFARLEFVDERSTIQFAGMSGRLRNAQEIATLMSSATEAMDPGRPLPVEASASEEATVRAAPTIPGDTPIVPEAAVLTTTPAARKLPPISLVVERRGERTLKSVLPIDVEIASSRNHRVLIGRLPTGVAFSTGQPAGLGLWQMRIGEFAGTQIVIDRSAPQLFELTLMLLDSGGTVVNGVDIAFRIADDARPPSAPVPSVYGHVETAAKSGGVDQRSIEPRSGSAVSPVPGPQVAAKPAPVPQLAPPRGGAASSQVVAAPTKASEESRLVVTGQPPPATVGATAPLPAPPAVGWSALLPKVTPGDPVKELGLNQ